MSRWVEGNPVRLSTENYLMRTLTTDDATETYVSWWNDPEVQSCLGFRARGWDTIRAKKHISQFNNTERFHLGVFAIADSTHIGFYTINCRPTRVASTNTVIGDKSYWGKGVVTETRPAILAFIFDELGADKVCSEIDGRNFAAILNIKKSGYKLEGILRDEHLNPNGERVDELRFGLLRSEWLEIKERDESKT